MSIKKLLLLKKPTFFSKKNKGSVDYDFILSIALFTIAYISLFTLLPYINISSVNSEDNLIQESNYLSTILVKYPGYPKNWTNTNNMISIGLSYYDNISSYPNILDLNKINQITTTSCNSLKPKTDVTTNFIINIKLNNGSNYNCTGTKPSNARETQRPIMIYDYNNNYKPGVLELYTW